MPSRSISRDLMSLHQEYMRSLPLNQRSAIQQYINGSSHINHLLREGFDVKNAEHCKYYGPEMTQRVVNMDNALMSKDLQRTNQRESREFVVYRGINSPSLGQVLEKFGYLHHPHYMSTSRLPTVASHAFAGEGCCVFKIEVDPSSSTCPMFLFVSHDQSSESEVLFQRNTYLNYLSKEIQNGKTTYRVSVSTKPVATSAPSSPSTPRCSTPGQVIIPITRAEVEDELAFLSDDDMKNEEHVIDTITESLQVAFKNLPLSAIRDTVKHLYKEIKNDAMNGGRRGKRKM